MIEKINTLLDDHFDLFFQNNNFQMKSVCHYIIKNGKRIRPLIAFDICNTISNGTRNIGITALSIEYIHTASLIIDDLPCMDNAKTRRNQECVHIKYGEAIAQLASIIFMSLAMDAIYKGTELMIEKNIIEKNDANIICVFFFNNFSHIISLNGASGGQIIDLTLSNKIPLDLGESLKNICSNIDPFDIIQKKTGVFFETSFLLGWIYGGGDMNKINHIKDISKNFSMIYQILDDLEDIEEDLIVNKKNISQNYAIHYGKDKAIVDIQNYIDIFIKQITELNLLTPFFIDLIKYINQILIKHIQ